MGESTDQLEWNIVAERQELGRNLHELENKAKALKDWRTYYRRHPLATVGVAFGGAMVLGLLTRRSRVRPEPAYDLATDDRRRTGFRIPANMAATADRVRRQAGDTWDHIADALIGVAAAKAIDVISHNVPGFGDEYAKRHPDDTEGSFRRTPRV